MKCSAGRRRLALTLDALAPSGVPVVGVGHSIGASTLLAMVGAGMWLGPGFRLPIAEDARLRSLCLLTASQAQWLADTLSASVTVDLCLVEEAGHFSFMDAPPPHAVDTVADKAAFLREFAGDVADFVRRVSQAAG